MTLCLVRVLYAELWGIKKPMLKCEDCPLKGRCGRKGEE